MDNLYNSNYMKALKSKPLKEVDLKISEHKKAMIDQDKKCAKCHKDLKPYMHSYVRDPKTKKLSVICSDCAIPIRSRSS